MGWYFNGCGCIETHEPASGWGTDYHGDVAALVAMGWDGVKFDGCGSLCNMPAPSLRLTALCSPGDGPERFALCVCIE